MRSEGKAIEAFSADPAGQNVVGISQSSDSPIRAVTNEIYTEILGQSPG